MNLGFYKRYLSRKMLVIFMLGFSSGLPLALSGSTLQAWLAIKKTDLMTIGMFSLVGAPYAYKYLWSPFIDKYVPPLFGRRRGWLLLTQLAIIAVILGVAALGESIPLAYLSALALALSFCSASQDIVYDAYRADSLSPDERGLGAALGVEGYRVGMFVSGALALFVADRYGWQMAYTAMAVFMLVGVVATLWAKEPDANLEPPKTLQEAVVLPFKEFLTRKRVLFILSFIILYKFGDAYAGALTNVFLINEVGLGLDQLAAVSKVVGLVATLSGIFLGGLIMTRLGLFNSLLTFGILQAISNLGYMLLSTIEPHINLVSCVVFTEFLCAGMGTAAFVAFLMALCNKRFSATQYALLSSFMATGRILVGPVSAKMIETVGWTSFYFSSLFFSLPGLFILWHLKGTINGLDNQSDEPEKEPETELPGTLNQQPAQV